MLKLFLDLLSAGSGEVDLDALLEDLCVMEKDMNFANETSLMPSQILSSSNCPLSPKVKVTFAFVSFPSYCMAVLQITLEREWFQKHCTCIVNILPSKCHSQCGLYLLSQEEFMIYSRSQIIVYIEIEEIFHLVICLCSNENKVKT